MMQEGITYVGLAPSSRARELYFDAPTQVHVACIACGGGMEPVARLVGAAQEVRVGTCSSCGYIGYIDRPSHEWFVEYYAHDWDTGIPETSSEIRARAELPLIGTKRSKYETFMLHEKLHVQTASPVVDVGSGYGEVLANFVRAGFTNCIGVENSVHRAVQTREVFDIEVLAGAFEDVSVQERLQALAPIGHFFTHHVIEHVYDPEAIIGLMSRLQQEGGTLAIGVPGAEGEHIGYAVMYLLHLHGFTKPALERLLNRHGYEVVEDRSIGNAYIIFGAVKKTNPQPRFELPVEPVTAIRSRIAHLFKDLPEGTHLITWKQDQQGGDVITTRHLSSYAFFAHIQWLIYCGYAALKRMIRGVYAGPTICVQRLNGTIPEVPTIRYTKQIVFLAK
jgi:SAM-dependent methyltransferase